MATTCIHVVPADDGWAVEVDGGPDRTVYPSQMAAIAAGWARAKLNQVDLLLYDRNGQVWARDRFVSESRDGSPKPPAIS